jgi:hypothetical protein
VKFFAEAPDDVWLSRASTVLAIYGFERHCETAATTWDDVIRMAAVQDLHSAWQEGQKNRADFIGMMLPA